MAFLVKILPYLNTIKQVLDIAIPTIENLLKVDLNGDGRIGTKK
jgi:hypothetical protein